MKYPIFFISFFILLSSAYPNDTIPLSLKGSEYLEDSYTLIIALPKRYRKKFKEMKVEVDIKIELKEGKQKTKTEIKTLECLKLKFLKKGKKLTIIKISLSAILKNYYYQRKVPWEKVKKWQIEEILKKGKNWRLVKI